MTAANIKKVLSIVLLLSFVPRSLPILKYLTRSLRATVPKTGKSPAARRLGRHVDLICADRDPIEEWAQERFARNDGIRLLAIEPRTNLCLHQARRYNQIVSLRGNATTDGEPASVAGETPAHDSTGRCDPVD